MLFDELQVASVRLIDVVRFSRFKHDLQRRVKLLIVDGETPVRGGTRTIDLTREVKRKAHLGWRNCPEWLAAALQEHQAR